MSIATYVAPSSIHGQGLFAKNRIPSGSLIGKLRGRRVKVDNPYVLWLSESEGFEVECDLKYINHSDRPNACYYDDLSVMAIRDIEAGEEITHDYYAGEW